MATATSERIPSILTWGAWRRSTKSITLVLSPIEACALRVLLDHVGGSPLTSPRDSIDNIRLALDDVVPEVNQEESRMAFDGGALVFRSKPIAGYFNLPLANGSE